MVLLGASGCCKTTLLRIIARLETPSAGEVWIGGRRVEQLPARERGIAMVVQNYAVFPHLTVFENIAFGLRMKKLPQAEVERRVNRTAELMHIEQLLKRYSGQLSGGQRQRVAVARATAPSTGKPRSRVCRQKASPPTLAAIPSMPTPPIARQKLSTTAISGWWSTSGA
ncbi:ATP-binding cassette domain-containing protein [Tabrizicola sp.]|uniref:ATP-binding cassette domain-containing protein n=1 Tax=Tabrizicola sp. TaxID=2005166 RepID=UPI003F3ACF15